MTGSYWFGLVHMLDISYETPKEVCKGGKKKNTTTEQTKTITL
jgi:hypothetical protein